MLTEKLVADIVLLYEISKQLLIFAILVTNLDLPRRQSETDASGVVGLDSLPQYPRKYS